MISLVTNLLRGHAKCVDLLLSHKELDIDRRSNKGTTALHDAAESNNVTIFEKLLSRGSRFLRNELNVSPLLTGKVSKACSIGPKISLKIMRFSVIYGIGNKKFSFLAKLFRRR